MGKSRLMLAALAFLHFSPLASAAPWDEPQDTAAAFSKPDDYAWRLFIALNWPADVPTKTANVSKKFGTQGPVVWETWRNARNSAPDTAFPADGSDPGPWLTPNTTVITRTFESTDPLPLQQFLRLKHSQSKILFDPVAGPALRNETRLNKATYEFVQSNGLFNLEGQEALAQSGRAAIEFPKAAKEVKAQWREIDKEDMNRYQWAELIDADGKKKLFGLVALHITTKDVPNWFWATFEHIDNKLPELQGGRKGNEGWLLKSVDRAACTVAPFDCEKIPQGLGLEGTRWENYRLRGVQLDFVDSRGNPTLLANSKPEEGFQQSSSCITCHSRATVGNKTGAASNRLSVFKPDDNGYVGAPDPKWFEDDGAGGKYTQLDFVWSFFRAARKK